MYSGPMIGKDDWQALKLALEHVNAAMELCDGVGESLAVCHLQLGADHLLAALSELETGTAPTAAGEP